MKRSVRKALPADELGRLQDRFEKLKASIRAKVEHPFHVIKNLFRHRKTRYRGLAKNEAQLFSLFGFANCCSPTGACRRFMAEVRPEGGNSGVKALRNRVSRLEAVLLNAFKGKNRRGEAG